jgi:hypothetical protein
MAQNYQRGSNMKKLFITLLMLSISSCANAFDYSAYIPATVSALRSEWDATTKDHSPGLSIFPFHKLKIDAVATQFPEQCKPKQLEKVFTILGQKDFLDANPVSTCIRLKENETGYTYFAYIQDLLLPALLMEVMPEDALELYVIFPAYTVRQDKSQNMPLFLITAFKKP